MPTVLIVDDEPGVRSALQGVLRDEGYQVDAVESGEACLERLARQPYDVVVLDVWLPGMDGLVTLTRMRERQVDAQVVIISGHGSVESAVRDQDGGVRFRREAAIARENGARRAQRAAAAPPRGR